MAHDRPGPAHDSRAVANAILDIADELSLPLTHMSVHKVSYYCHGWQLAANGSPLIRQEFEAWRDGPVQRLVWDCFRVAGKRPVTGRATKKDLFTNQIAEVREECRPAERAWLREVVGGYGHLHAFELSEMTHEEGGPWHQVWHAPNGKVTLGMRITHDAIRDHFVRVSMTARPAS